MNAPAEGARIEAELRALQDGAVPTKTARGREELSHRRGELRPRLRSLLLLTDGQRSLANLRSMAVQTGGTLLDVDELLRGGYIELPAPPAAALPVLPVPEHEPTAVAAAAAATIEPRGPVTAATVESPGPAAAAPATPAPTSTPKARAALPARVGASKSSPPSAAAVPAAVPSPAAPVQRVEARSPAAASHAVEPAAPASRAELNQTPHAPESQGEVHAEVKSAAPQTLDLALPLDEGGACAEASAALSNARDLLRDWLALDGPRGNGRLRSLQSRIEQAPDIDALVVLLEEAEAQIPLARRSHQAQLRIAQLCDVLGLGNTRTAEDTQPGASDEAGAWAPTLPGQ